MVRVSKILHIFSVLVFVARQLIARDATNFSSIEVHRFIELHFIISRAFSSVDVDML